MLKSIILVAAVAAALSIPLSTSSPASPNLFALSNGEGILRDWEVNGICDTTVKSLSGYFNVTTATKEYFFWFFESRVEPSKAPVVLWLTGGPGCSSEVALFGENGPCSVNANLSTTFNPNSWNANANLLYIDQPAGTGFSYGKASDMDHNEEGVSRDLNNFVQAFMQAHPEYSSNDFYIFGESYAGHYVPASANAIYQNNLKKLGVPINMKGIGVGNGLTAPEIQYKYYPEMAFTNKAHPLVNKTEYEVMKVAAKACTAAIEVCQKTKVGCGTALEVCNLGLVVPIQLTGINLYNVREKCEHPPLCYDFSAVGNYLNQPDVRKALGVDQDREWKDCNMVVNKMFMGDWMQHFQMVFPDMLASGIRVLIYAGDLDFICNYMGNKAWTLDLEWSGKQAFNAEGDHDWIVDGKTAGLARTTNGFTFLQVYEAGHMVPMDQPVAALSMLESFLNNKAFY